MLETLTIKNIAVIDAAEIPFKKGLNILSGETGAGKSIVVEAIAILLGGRATTELVRSGCDEAIIEGLFNISEIQWMPERLARLGFESESSELLIKRIVSRNSRHRIYINGELATLAILQSLCDGLVDLCSQHEHQSLVRPNTQLDLVDRFGGLTEKVRNFGNGFHHYRSLTRERDALAAADAERTKRSDFLKFQIQELQDANLQTNEDENLHTEKRLLQSAEQRAQSADSARLALENEDGGALNALQSALNRVKTLAQLDNNAGSIANALERAIAETEDATLSLNRYLNTIEFDSDRLQTVQDRLALLANLRRKYGATTTEMIATLAALELQATQIEQMSQRIGAINGDIIKAEIELRKQAEALSKNRQKIGEMLACSVSAELKDLKMEDASFKVAFEQKNDPAEWTTTGADQTQFLVCTNRGEETRPLGKIASGGELSRLLLALRRVIADRGGIGVYLFDEIDAGIGGQTAFQVGRKLKSVAAYNQVICITHQPQIASFADHHLSVRKSARGQRTATEVIELSTKERKEEIARMLGGPELTKKTLENAAELIQLAN